jgi:hypothetical protein
MKTKILARVREGNYKDQHGIDHECYEVMEVQKIEHEKTTYHESGYEGEQIKIFWAKDTFGRKYRQQHHPLSLRKSYRWIGPDSRDDEDWVELDELRKRSERHSKPLLTPQDRKVPEHGENFSYAFYETTQLSVLMRE